MPILNRKTLTLMLLFLLPLVAFAQTTKKKPVKKVPASVAKPKPTPEPVAEVPVKKNERPDDPTETASGETVKSNKRGTEAPVKPVVKKDPSVYFYEFDRPGFTYPRVLIEHDEAGKGKISFMKTGFDEFITDPIDLSTATLDNIRGALTALNFLDSTENYQYQKDFSNLGNVTITVKKSGRERSTKYNWTSNKDAKALMDEYRRIGNQYIWKFEITIARENQPLETPMLMDMIDTYIKNGEITHPPQMVPFLTELSNDERLPLIARNHATKLIQQIEKPKK